jgi:hypothetical protein
MRIFDLSLTPIRRCGNVFCAPHSAHFLPLNQNGRVHPEGVVSRVCDSCFDDYRRLRAARRSGSVSSGSTLDGSSTPPRIRGVGIKPRTAVDGVQELAGRVGSYVGSVPRDWSWSTF